MRISSQFQYGLTDNNHVEAGKINIYFQYSYLYFYFQSFKNEHCKIIFHENENVSINDQINLLILKCIWSLKYIILIRLQPRKFLINRLIRASITWETHFRREESRQIWWEGSDVTWRSRYNNFHVPSFYLSHNALKFRASSLRSFSGRQTRRSIDQPPSPFPLRRARCQLVGLTCNQKRRRKLDVITGVENCAFNSENS